jgi:hypothetical protein
MIDRQALASRLAEPPGGDALSRRGQLARVLAASLPQGPLPAEGEALDALAGGAPLLVAGQQAGLLLGPAYTLHKLLGLLALKRRLEAELQAPVCALWWIEANDHDWIEAARVAVPGQPEWKPDAPDGAPGRSVGRIPLPAAWIGEARAALPALLGDDPAGEAPAWLELQPGETLADAFQHRLRSLFASSGLLSWNPSTPAARELAVPFFRRLQDRSEAVAAALSRQAARLRAAGRPLPVEPGGGALWFVEDEQGRRRRAEVHQPLAHAGLLSPDVLSRPLLQDWLFAPAATLLGPGEAAYHEQLEGLDSILGLRAALRLPRPRLQWIREEDRRALGQAGLDPWAPPQAGQPWPAAFLAALPGGVDALADRRALQLEAARWKERAEAWDRRTGRMALTGLAERGEALAAQLAERIDESLRALHKPRLRELHGHGRWQDGTAGAQERRVNSAALLLRHGGADLLEAALEHIDPFEPRQQRLVTDPARALLLDKELEP